MPFHVRRPPKGRREKAGAPIVRSILRHPARIGNRDVGGQILTLTAERIGRPRAETGESVENKAGREKVLGGAVGIRLAREGVAFLRKERDFNKNSLPT